MFNKIEQIKYPILFVIIVFIFFWKFFVQGLLPIPADTIVGLYHPFRDSVSDNYPNGIPYKNSLITDPVRQQYPWRVFSIDQLSRGAIPTWNPYQFAGTPHLANLQSVSFYPLNIVLFISPFHIGWSFLIMLQPLLAGIFMFLFLKSLRLKNEASFLGGIIYAFSGFSIAWLTWNTVGHVALWLPLILLAEEHIFTKRSIVWIFVFILAQSMAVLAGHLQILFYIIIVSNTYLIMRMLQLALHEKCVSLRLNKALRVLVPFFLSYIAIIAITAVQWIPTLKFILSSSRIQDQSIWQQEGWFLPYVHLAQFIAPDFFGNPTTLNYWGTWNYGELIGYVGMVGLIIAFVAMISRRDKKTLFFGTLFFISLLFAVPTFLAKLPFQLQIPFLNTSQPTRLLFIIDFALATLVALGMDRMIDGKVKLKEALGVLISIGTILGLFWLFGVYGEKLLVGADVVENLAVTRRNLILPTVLLVVAGGLILWLVNCANKKCNKSKVVVYGLLVIAVFDLFRFGWKFIPFTNPDYLFPTTKVIAYLQKRKEPFRVMSTDKRILPPNFSMQYGLQSVSGYDPLYLSSYGEFASAWIREEPDISSYSFNRIITPQNYNHRFADLLNVRYILSFDDISTDSIVKVFEEGKTKVYENTKAFPRTFLAESILVAGSKQEAISMMYNPSVDLSTTAIVFESVSIGSSPLTDDEVASIVSYLPNEVVIATYTNEPRLLILSDVYYPSWSVRIDGLPASIYVADYTFRAVVVPAGEHEVRFINNLL